MTTRRTFLKGASVGAGVILLGRFGAIGFAAENSSLADWVAAILARLAPLGWRQLLSEVTLGELDIAAKDLTSELVKPLRNIDRSYPGFGDFSALGNRAVEPGSPSLSLIYHALASPTVVRLRGGSELTGFPTLSEIDALENYVYSVQAPSLNELRQRAGNNPLGIVVFALQYRNTPRSVQGKHAELCFSRTGVARLGTIEPLYDPKRRIFLSHDPQRPFEFRVIPQRFAAYIAMHVKGDRDSIGPQDFLEGDEKLQFWVPLHKLFDGPDCIAGLNLRLDLSVQLINDKLKRFHEFMKTNGYVSGWGGKDLENDPFVIRDEQIATLSRRSEFGTGVLQPKAQPLVVEATYQGKRLSFTVDGRYTSDPANLEWSSMQILPGGAGTPPPKYHDDAEQNTQRPAPEYLNIRHRVLPNGQIDNLNRDPDMMKIIAAGGYQAQHYIDFDGNGWIEARCAELEGTIETRVPAFCMVAPPDFFPKVNQRELMVWWRDEVPKAIRSGLWAIQPLALSQVRIAADITLPVGFSINDTTVTAIVSQPTTTRELAQTPNGPMAEYYSGMPDSLAGLFDPGWDSSQGIYFTAPENPLQRFLQGYGLGSPFLEDVKLCAALGSYWPAVAPDDTRTFVPNKYLEGVFYPWPTINPLTDEEIGINPHLDGTFMPWSGVRGPHVRDVNGRSLVAYQDANRADYLDLMGTMTAALTGRIDQTEYQARTLAMAAAYWALGIRDPDFVQAAASSQEAKAGVYRLLRAKADWAVLSFRVIEGSDAELGEAEGATKTKLAESRRYRFHVYRWGKQEADPNDIQTVLVEMLEQAIIFVSGSTALIRRDTGPWVVDTSIPM
jgi:hypothetical protein